MFPTIRQQALHLAMQVDTEQPASAQLLLLPLLFPPLLPLHMRVAQLLLDTTRRD